MPTGTSFYGWLLRQTGLQDTPYLRDLVTESPEHAWQLYARYLSRGSPSMERFFQSLLGPALRIFNFYQLSNEGDTSFLGYLNRLAQGGWGGFNPFKEYALAGPRTRGEPAGVVAPTFKFIRPVQ
jgi:hypothetical protein